MDLELTLTIIFALSVLGYGYWSLVAINRKPEPKPPMRSKP